MAIYPLLKISLKDLAGNNLNNIFKQNIDIPKRLFPPNFKINNKDYYCGGYFISYDHQVSFANVATQCREGNWDYLANLVADFFIVYCDFSSKKIYILTDQGGKFPCYFSVNAGKLVLSLNFALVKDNLSKLTLNKSVALDYLADNQFGLIDNTTIISEIKKLPPATLLTISKNLSYKLKSLVHLNSFLSQKKDAFRSVEKFKGIFLRMLKNLVEERLDATKHLKYASDLSSGFDSSLVCYFVKKLSRKTFLCYSMVSEYTRQDTDPHIIRDFAKKHKLNVCYVDISDYYPFAKKNDLRWNTKYPSDAMYEAYLHFLKRESDGKNVVSFSGDGGDEIYHSYKIEEVLPYSIQNEYFLTIERLQKYNLGLFLTKKGIRDLLSKDRFGEKNFYPVLLPTSIVTTSQLLFPLHWEAGVWSLMPFADPRLVQLARRIPKINGKFITRQELWKRDDEIFVRSQFRPKIGPDKFIKLFLEKKLDFVAATLKKSVLQETGLVQTKKILEDVDKRNIEKYSGDALVYLHNLLRLEYFLQENNINLSA